MNGTPLIELCRVSARYGWGGPWVLRDVDARVDGGALVRVRGANGAGKSTLLRLLAGATLPTRGRRRAVAALAVGYAPDRLAPPPPLSAADYLRHHRRLRRRARVEGEPAVVDLTDRLALTPLLDERLDALSRGTLQKVVLVQALLGTPDALILDEPFNALDLDARDALIEILAERRAGGAAVVLSDHSAIDAPPIADVTWQLAEAALRPQATRAPAGADGVIERRGDDRYVSLLVSAGHSDRTLVALVEDGWHVESVTATREGNAVRIEARPAPGVGAW
jgi:ABC-2 type transport system ATP-binding protein